MTAKLSPDDKVRQLAVDFALKEYGLQCDGHRIQSCGSHTGHTLKDMALAITPEVAAFIVRACNSHHELLSIVGIFLGHDGRFQVAVGGNPNAVDAMLAKAREVYAKATGGQP